jgi:hypothetical protein
MYANIDASAKMSWSEGKGGVERRPNVRWQKNNGKEKKDGWRLTPNPTRVAIEELQLQLLQNAEAADPPRKDEFRIVVNS